MTERIKSEAGVFPAPEIVRTQNGKLGDKALAILVGFMRDITTKLNGNISFGDGTANAYAGNLDAQVVQWTFPTVANELDEIPHRLGRIPIGFIVIAQDVNANVYGRPADSTNFGPWSTTALFLKSNVASLNATMLVF